MTLGQIRHATLEMNDYYPLIARAVERLDRSTGETRRAVYERARKAIAQLLSNQPALLDADITKERLALEEAIRKVEAEAARKSPTETRTEPQSAPSEGMPDGDDKSRDHGQPASPDRDDRPPALPSRQAPIFLPARPMTATTQISRPAAAWVCCPEERRGSPATSDQAVAR